MFCLTRVGICFFLFKLVLVCCNEENNGAAMVTDDSPKRHEKLSKSREHLLAHLSDRMDLDGEGLRHIRKHLRQIVGDNSQDAQDIEKGDNTKGMFYFFKLHDYDNNEKLDGLEWLTALTDFHADDNHDDKAAGKNFLENEAESIIDELLEKHDRNEDGFIDFVELMNTKIDSLMTELDKPDPEDKPQQQQGQKQ